MTRAKSRAPGSWPPPVLRAVTLAQTRELLIPFETTAKVRAFRKLINDVRRSFREHEHPDAHSINTLKCIEYETADVIKERPDYFPDGGTEKYPYTVILSPAAGFLSNLDNAVITSHSTTEPLSAPTLPLSTIEQELIDMLRDTEGNTYDDDGLASIFNKRG